MLKAAKAYLSTQVTTATQGDLLLLLYDTAIKHIKQAKDKIVERDYAAKGILITKAIEIVSELHECLNKEKGGEVAKNLSKVYFLCNTRLLQANMEMNPARLDEVVGILSGLRHAFAQIIPGQEGMAPASQSAMLRSGGEPGAEPAAYAPSTPQLPTPQSSMPQPLTPQPQIVLPGPDEAGVAEVAEPGEATSAEDATPPPDRAPVNTARFRAASAYANSR
ncbi:MAG: flagellar export chaperone FliS [Desulfovibrionales bacterium GWA2_65_9]|nr:MAG: flagellar export chaperone FliS [Desulfovibrionales bacterium GWA2_65_9]